MSKSLIRGLVVAFVLLDVALGVLAWRHLHGGPSAAVPPGSLRAPTDNPADLPGNGEDSDIFQTQDPATATMFDASDSGVLVVATAGTCDGAAPTVMISEDGGQNFEPVKPDVDRVLAVNVRASGTVDIVGADDDCETVGLTSTDGGASWTSNGVGTDWYRDPESPTGVALGTNTADAGCDVMAVSSISANSVRVSCGDGTVRATDDAGDSWTTVGGLTAVRALNFRSRTSGVALAQTDDCPVSAFLTVDGGETWEQRGCADGQIARAVLDQDDRILASVDATVSESADGGLTWTPPTSDAG